MRLKLNRTLRAALIAAITAVGTTLPQTQATEKYTAPAFGGAEYVWTNGHWEYPAGTTVNKIARVDNKGGVMVIDNAGTVSNPVGVDDTSDYGGVKVTGKTTFTTGLGSWAGSIYVGAAAVLNASYGVSLKNTEAETAANVYVDGTLNITNRNTLNLNDGRDYQNWYIGKEGFINLSSITGVTKGNRAWNIQVAVEELPEIVIEDYANRKLGGSVTRQFMSTGTDLTGSVNSWKVFMGDKELTEGTGSADNYTISYGNGGFNVTYGYGSAIEKMTLTWKGGEGTWAEKDSTMWLSGDVATSFVSGDDVEFGGTDDVAKVSGAVSVGTLTVTGTATIDTSADGASVAANTLNIAAGGRVTTAGAGDSINFDTLTGSGDFVKENSGTLVLNGNNSSYSGTITVNEGTLDITNWNSLGSQAPTAGANGTIQLTTNSLPDSLTVNGEGTLRLLTSPGGQNVNLKTIKAPTLKLAADSAHNSRFVYEAGSDISEVQHLYFDGGQLWLDSGDTVLNYGGTITFGTENHYSEGGGLDSAFRVNASAKFSGAVDVQKAAKITWQAGGKYVEFADDVTGSGNLTLATYNNGQYNNSRFIISGDASKYTGSITTSHTCITVEVASGGKLAMGSNSNLTGAVTLAGEIIVNDSATISGAITGAGTLTKNGAGTLTLSGNSSGFSGTTTVNAGALNMNGGSLGGILTVGESAAATFNGAVTLASHIQNSGRVVFNSGSSLTLTCSLDDLEGETTYTAGDNGFISGVEKSIASGAGTVTGLSSVTIGGATYTKDGGQITEGGAISIHDTNYSTYYLRTEGAEVDVLAHQAAHAEFTKIDVTGKDGAAVTGNILVNGTVNLDSLHITSGNTASVALSEGATSATANITALTHDGTLDIGSGVTVHYAPTTLTMTAGKTLTTTGEGTFEVTTLTVTGGTLDISSDMKVTGGDDGKGGTKNQQGLAITDGSGSISILGGTTTVTGAVYTGGGSTGSTINVGTGNANAVLVARRIELGDHNGDSSAFNIGTCGTVVVTGNEDIRSGNNPQKNTSLQLSEWNQEVTTTIQGRLYAKDATAFMSRDHSSIIRVDGGIMAVKGIATTYSDSTQTHTVSIDNGGKIVMGTFGLAAESGAWDISVGTGEIGMYDSTTTVGRAITVNGTLTLNTTKYAWSGEGAGLALNPGTEGGTMTVSGALSGTGKLVAAGAGTLELSGANTHAGTVVNGGTLKAASAGALGSGDVTVNAGALELTTTTAVAGALTINDGGKLVFAGENKLTADTLALGSGTVTFDLSNISVSRAGTITLATATTSAGLGSATVQVVWEGLAPIFSYGDVQVSDNSWIINLTSTSQNLYWHGGTANWDATALSWHTEAAPEEPVAFISGDTAIFAADSTKAVANISGAMVTGGVIVREGADVVLQKATEAQEASISAPEIEISGALVSSVDMTATDIVGRGTAATWEIAAGSTVTTATLSADEGATLTISGGGSLSAGTVTGDGTIVFTGDIQPEYSKIVVAEGKELELKGSVTRTISKDNLAIDGKLVIGEDYSLDIDGQYNPGITGTDLHIRNNGNLAVSLGNDQNVLRMDEQSAGNLEIKSGYISYLSELGNQTLVMDNGTQLWFGNNAGAQDNPDFTNDIALNGDVTLRVYGSNNHASVTISGDVDGAGHTLTKTDGNQVLTFTGKVTLGGLNVEGSGEKLVFKGSGSNLGAIKATSGAFTIQFSKADGEGTASYTFDTFAMSPDNHGATRWLIVDAGVTVEGTGDTLSDEHATIMNSWGINNGGLEVNGTLITKGVIGMDSGDNTSYIKGTGTINTKGLDLCNVNTTYIQGGITVNITSDTGIYRRNHGNASTIHLLDATLRAKDADWEFKDQNDANYTVTLDSASGTTFDAATGHTITLSKGMGGSGKLVKAGEGTVLAKGANTYSGGTEITAGTLETKNASALGTGNVSVGGNGTLLVSENLTIKGDSTAANNGLDNQGIVSIADGKTLTLWALAAAKHYNLGTVNAVGDSAIIENTNHCATISLDAITGGASSVVLYSNHSSEPANWNLGTAEDGVYSAGELVLRVGDSTSTGGNRTVNYNFNNAEMFSGTTVTIENAAIGTPGKTMTNNVVLNADEVHVGGINDAAEDTVVDKRNWSVAKGGDVDGRATLVLDADNTEAAYSTAIKVGADVDIRKTGEGVQTFSGDMSSFEGTVAVEKGTINVLNVDELSVQDVVIGAGATLGVYNDATATATSATEGTVAIDEGYSLTAAAGATLNANLVLNAGSALDVSATLGEGLQMGSDVALYTGDLLAVTPWPDAESTTDVAVVDAYLRAFFAQGDHEYYTLFTDVDMFSIDEVVQTKDLTFRDWLHFDLDAASVFGNLIENTYALVYHMGANAGKGTVALKMIPEPTTGTLSLLALVALAARRRKHN